MYCGWRPIQRVFRLKRRKRALIGREQTTGSAGGSDFKGGTYVRSVQPQSRGKKMAESLG